MAQTMPEIPRRGDADLGRVFSSGVQVGRTSYGLGLFAFAYIPKGTPMGRVPGRLVHDPDYGSDYCISAGEGSVLEPGAPFCYLNHSCEPNCQLMQYVRDDKDKAEENLEVGEISEDDMDFMDDDEEEWDADWNDEEDECYFGDGAANAECDECAEEVGQDEEAELAFEEPLFEDDADAEIWVESTRDIFPGDELTIDYAWPADRAARCLCGSPNCRGWIVDPAELGLLQTDTAPQTESARE